MAECPYCDASFETDGDLLDHLGEAHEGELGPIDRRRVARRRDDGDGVPVRTVAIVATAVVVIGGAIAGVFLLTGGSGDDGMRSPSNLGSVHAHGTMSIAIDGTDLDLAEDPRFVLADDYFHFHGGDSIWHVHGQGVTLEYALATLGIEVSPDGSRLTFDDETYDDGDPDTTVSITVDGEPVEPRTYELEGVGPVDQARAGAGDDVVVVVEVAG